MQTWWSGLTHWQRSGLTFAVMGVVLTFGYLILDATSVINPSSTTRSGMLGMSEGMVIVGIVMFLIGRRRK